MVELDNYIIMGTTNVLVHRDEWNKMTPEQRLALETWATEGKFLAAEPLKTGS